MTTDKTTITKEKLNLFVVCGKHYITNAENKSELWHAINSLLPVAVKKLQKVEREKELFRLSICKKSSSKHIEMDKHGRYQFTEEDNKKLLEKFDEIELETVTIPCHVIEEFPEEGLSYDMRKGFEGIVIPATEEVVFEEETE
jgi:hypothetical protein